MLVNGSLSGEAKITSGCPQGTLLGCICYVLYTNSIKFAIPESIRVKIYADDTRMYTVVNNEDDRNTLQNAIDLFFNWTQSLDLMLSLEKIYVLHYGRNNKKFDYFISGFQIKDAETMRELVFLYLQTQSPLLMFVKL